MPRALLRGFVIIVLSLSAASFCQAQETFGTITGWDQQLFPSYILVNATMRTSDAGDANDRDNATDAAEQVPVLGDPHGLLGVQVEAPADNTPITVTVECSEILERSMFRGTLETAGAAYNVFPHIRYRFRSLVRNKQATPLAITYTVKVGDNEPESFADNATLRSVHDCPFAIKMPDGEVVDTSYMFAAYVNEQHPFVDKLLREALDDGIVESFTGYQSDDPADLYRQVYALWHALTKRDVRYSSITASEATNSMVYCQHVRLIDESINNSQANCVDGAVLLASMMREINIEPVLIVLPHHCYVAFYLDRDHTKLIGLETTLIGDKIASESAPPPGAHHVVNDKWRAENSWRSFCAAVELGTQDLEENRAKFEEDPDYRQVSIEDARDSGILPIAFDAINPFKARTGSHD
jgi:hypothetical protein